MVRLHLALADPSELVPDDPSFVPLLQPSPRRCLDPPHDPETHLQSASHSGPSTTRRSSISLSTGKLPQSLLNPKTFKKTIDQLFQSISNHRSSSIFQVPIRANDAPDYRSIVHRPMDLRTIKGRIRDGHIGTVDEFERDIMLMFANALIYNDPESEVYLRTEEVRTPFIDCFRRV